MSQGRRSLQDYPRFRAVLFGVLFLAGCSATRSSSTLPPAQIAPAQALQHPLAHVDLATGLARGLFLHVCDAAAPGQARCHAIIRTDTGAGRSPQAAPNAPSVPAGYGPVQLQTAYGLLNSASTSGAVVGIVDAYDDPNLESDLTFYRSSYGLPACTTANGCFAKVNQSGVQGSYPKTNGNWAQETSLDVDMVSANCPACRILVVEANSASSANLAAGVDTAARLGAVAISNSYGSKESSKEADYRASYTHAGVAVTVSSGDSGFGAQSPASYNTVIAVGGTSLTLTAGNTRASETVWSGAGSGCSAYETKPAWQAFLTGCANRVIADVAYDADPNTGVAVYDSLAFRGQSGWLVFGGTSVASPAIAAIYARAGNTAGVTYPASYAYGHVAYGSDLYDVTSGSNGSCSPAYLCTGGTGYDGPTGLGTPIGLSAF
jgi:subtilase family serine protease